MQQQLVDLAVLRWQPLDRQRERGQLLVAQRMVAPHGRAKAALILTFLVPFALIFVFGRIFGGSGNSSGPNGVPLAVVNASDNPAALKLVEALKAEKAFDVKMSSRLGCQAKLEGDGLVVVRISKESLDAYYNEHPAEERPGGSRGVGFSVALRA